MKNLILRANTIDDQLERKSVKIQKYKQHVMNSYGRNSEILDMINISDRSI